ncbi:uncharacterized protein LOC120850225 [Ixodes scapularis]|uniref:uncharacterized protein LOC120850225 n=1 Tax=Ixodes scapularis TaxID=6945 RepID=UPI001A9F7628|nr:uncharacterized protein LOC120850225 [Ixodes scapularis]
MVSVLSSPEQHEDYFDNFFTSYGLLTKLADEAIRATGTVRETRMGSCPLRSQKDIAQEERGAFDYKRDGWILHCELHKGTDAAMTHLAFTRDVAMSLLHLKQKLALRPGLRVYSSISEMNTDGHYIFCATQERCAE